MSEVANTTDEGAVAPIAEAVAETPAVSGAAEAASGEGAPATPEAAAAVAHAPLRPEALSDEFWDDQNGVKVSDLVHAYNELKSKADAAVEGVPESPDGYEVGVSEAVTIPEGFEVSVDRDDPLLKEVAAVLHEAGQPQQVMQKLIDAYAKVQIAGQQQAVQRDVEQMQALGERAGARVEAAKNWITANLPSALAEALLNNIGPAAIPAIEHIVKMRSGPSVPSGVGVQANPLDGLRGEALLEALRT
ncbi:MAG: hypothetical protein ACK4E3_03590 [Brevundimonas sp.]|uniref:hypothetical protein n=1 Tax=Brevundimonas sp. TaxID=1871086 RepID=UPI00391D0756